MQVSLHDGSSIEVEIRSSGPVVLRPVLAPWLARVLD